MVVKQSVDELALFGGRPAFAEPLHVGRPNIGDRAALLDRINDLLDRRWLSNNGVFVKELERRVADFLGVKHCIAMCNATIALEIVIRALELKGEVIIPSFTFIATAHALQWQKITPVFCDIDPQTHNLDPRKIERMLTPRTTGIIGVHCWGRAFDLDGLEAIAQKHQLRLLFDAAHAFGCSHKGRMIGNFGNAEVFSFHATKFFNTFEGGAVVTNDHELATKVRSMKNFGFADYDKVVNIGTNGKMSEVSAAMGLTGLDSLGEFIEANRRNYEQYQEGLANTPGLDIIRYDDEEKNNYQYIIVEIDENTTNVNRDQLVTILHAENVLARRYFYPGCHQMEPYLSYFPHAGLLLPETEKLTKRVMSLPSGTAVKHDDVTRICEIIRYVIQNGSEVGARAPSEDRQPI